MRKDGAETARLLHGPQTHREKNEITLQNDIVVVAVSELLGLTHLFNSAVPPPTTALIIELRQRKSEQFISISIKPGVDRPLITFDRCLGSGDCTLDTVSAKLARFDPANAGPCTGDEP